MKSLDMQKLVLSKFQSGDGPTKIFNDLNGTIGLSTVKRWCKMITETGSINLSKSPGRPRTARTKIAINKVKQQLRSKKNVSTRKLSKRLDLSRTSVRRILKDELNCYPYKKIIEPALTDEHIAKRKKFANWIRTNFKKQETMKILFSDEKMFYIEDVYDYQNDRIWAVDRVTAKNNGGIKKQRKFPQKVMVWMGACSKGLTPLVIFDKGTVDHARYIKEVLPVALKYGNKVFGNVWTFQQDGARPHTHHLTQQWCKENFPSFICKDHWPPNSPYLNPLDYSIWNEFAQAIDWNKVTSRATLIKELKRAVKKIRQEVILESCHSWTKRLYRLKKNNGCYLH